MSSEQQYEVLARLYDAIYHFKNYPEECSRLRVLLHQHGISDGSRLIDAACGTGAHLQGLMPYFQCAGFDLHAGILEIARAKLPGIPLFQADLRSFTVPEPVDALLCLFSAIGYLLSREDLSAFARAAAQAVKPGGMLIIEPWLTEENWQTGRPTLQTYSSTDLQLARATVAEKDGQLAIMDMNWLIARRNQPIQHLVDRHVMWLCPHAVLVEVFTEAGFAARFEPDGLMKDRGLLLGVRR